MVTSSPKLFRSVASRIHDRLRKLAPVQPIAVNGRSVTAAYLADGDRVSVGGVEVLVAITPAAPGANAPGSPAVPPDLDERLHKFAELEQRLQEQTQELETDRIIWYRRRDEIEAECQRRKEALEELGRRGHQEERDLSLARAELEARLEVPELGSGWRARLLFALAQVRHAHIAVVAHISNATDHEGEPFNRGSQDDGVRILTAICKDGLVAA